MADVLDSLAGQYQARTPSWPVLYERMLKDTDAPGLSGDIGEEALCRIIWAMNRQAYTPAQIRAKLQSSWESVAIRLETFAETLVNENIEVVIGQAFSYAQLVPVALEALATGHVVAFLAPLTPPYLPRWYLPETSNGSFYQVLDPYTARSYAVKYSGISFDQVDVDNLPIFGVVRTKSCAYDDPEINLPAPSPACLPSPVSGDFVGANWPPPWEEFPPPP